MDLVSKSFQFFQEIKVRNLLVSITRKLPDKFTDFVHGIFGLVTTSGVFDAFFKKLWPDLTVILLIILLENIQEMHLKAVVINFSVQVFVEPSLIINCVHDSSAEVGEHSLDFYILKLILELIKERFALGGAESRV